MYPPLKISSDIFYVSFISSLAKDLKPLLVSYHVLKSSEPARSLKVHIDADCKHEEKVSSLVRKLWAERKPCDNCNISRAIHWQKPRVAADQSWLVTPS